MEIIKYDFKGNPLRSGIDNGTLWFCAADVLTGLNYKNHSDAITRHCISKGVAKHDTPTDGGIQAVTYIDESNMYRLIMGSKQKNAEEFKTWVVEDVLVSIRKTGSYSVQKPVSPAQLLLQQAQAMVEMENQIQEVKNEVNEIKAKITSSPNDYFAVAGYASLIHKQIDVKTAAELGRKASLMCKNLGYTTHSMPDPRFGSVKLYPVEILKTIFDEKNLK